MSDQYTVRPQILIVGAGPTGLTAAAVLTKLGIRVRIIDKNPARSDKSKALGVQAGALECLRDALGPDLPKEMITAGKPVYKAWIHINEHKPILIDLSIIPSQFNFILVLEQSETERLFEEYLAKLSIHVERQTELISAEDSGSQVRLALKNSNGETEEITSDFLIGCDGSHSTVRHLAGIPFDGAPYTGDFILGDVYLKWPWEAGAVRTFISNRGVIASFPIRGDRYRLILIPHFNQTGSNPDISLDEFKEVVSKLSQDQIAVTDATWLTRFRVHHRMVEHFQKGRIFLAGDAAHIHSPAGGQGMNIGIQDALNLGFKLTRVLHGSAPFESLHDYEKERLPIAKKVVWGTDFFFKMVLKDDNSLVSFFRNNVFPALISSKIIQRKLVIAISEVGVAARERGRYTSISG